jgi:NADPH:quinone reductase-like Zn-dependent oxidoreductase
MKDAVVPKIGAKWEVKEVPTPEPSANQVLIKVMQVDSAIQMYISLKAGFHCQ